MGIEAARGQVFLALRSPWRQRKMAPAWSCQMVVLSTGAAIFADNHVAICLLDQGVTDMGVNVFNDDDDVTRNEGRVGVNEAPELMTHRTGSPTGGMSFPISCVLT